MTAAPPPADGKREGARAQTRTALEMVGVAVVVVYLAALGAVYFATDAQRPLLLGSLVRSRTLRDQLHEFARSAFFLSGALSSDESSPLEIMRAVRHPSQPLAWYTRDWRDLNFVLTWGLILYLVRTVLTHTVFLPLGRVLVKRPTSNKASLSVLQDRYVRKVHRFGEQAWTLTLYTTSLVLVVTVILRLPFCPVLLKNLWLDYPSQSMDAMYKAVYLWEASNYIHQLFAINLEARRSDFWQMLTHHVVTLCLIGSSFAASFHRVGYGVLLLMDPADVCLSTAKLLKYIGWQKLCDVMFGVFMLTWTITRHVLYMVLLWSCYHDAPRYISFRTSVDWVSGHMLTRTTYTMFLVLLTTLQVILLIWFVMIIKVAIHVLTKGEAIDSRSDDDSD